MKFLNQFLLALVLVISFSSAQAQDQRQTARKYAKQCGLDETQIKSALNGKEFSAREVISFLSNTKTQRTYCSFASDIMLKLSPNPTKRTKDDAEFMFFLGIIQAGSYLKELTDLDKDGLVDNPPFDGSIESGFCSPADMSDGNISQMGSGLSMAVSNLLILSSMNVNPMPKTRFTSIMDICGSFTPNHCLAERAQYFINDIQALKAVRTILNTQASSVQGLPCP